jgi:DNA-binding protein HU-beta
MNKTDLIDNVAESTELSKADVTRAISATFDAITAGLVDGDKIAIPGFGTFEVGFRAARTGRNPQTGEAIEIAAARVVKFKAGKALKETVNEGAAA